MLDLERERFIGRTFGLSSCVGLLGYEYIALWMLGFSERSMQTSERCVALAREVGHPPSIGFALTARTGSCYLQGDPKGTFASADEALRVAREDRLGFFEPVLTVYRGWGLSELGDPAEGIAQIRGAIESYRAAGNGALQVWMNVILAAALWKAGKRNEVFSTLANVMTLARKNGEGLFEPELYRLKGEFLFAQAMGAAGPPKAEPDGDRATKLADAESCIRDSLELARRQEARMLELRSLVSLCRVRRELGAVSHERKELAEVCDAFTEGVETPDLREARVMLEICLG
jgi:adenylate cyclase